MRISLLLFFVFYALGVASQSFEGKLLYEVEYEFSSSFDENIRQRTITLLKEKGEYYDSLEVIIEGGNYLKSDNAENGKKVLYYNKENRLYFFSKSSNIVMVGFADKPYLLNRAFPKPSITTTSSEVLIGDYSCKSILLSWGELGFEEYYYTDKDLEIDPNLFKDHKFEFLNVVIAETKHYPIKIVKSANGIKIIMTLVSIDKVSPEKLIVPQLRKAKRNEIQLEGSFEGLEAMVLDN